MAERAAEIAGFLKAAGWGGADREPLAGDASARRYQRLRNGRGVHAVLMDAPGGAAAEIDAFLRIARHLRAAGFSAPEILAADRLSGLVLMEDLGDALFARLCSRAPAQEAQLYEAATDLLVALRAVPAPEGLPAYDRETYLRESRLLTEWYLPAAAGTPTPPDLAAEFDALVAAATDGLERAHDGLVLRDYHAENLIWLPQRRGHARVGLLDFQDALCGHAAYDLISLLEDARRDTSPELRAAMRARHLARSGLEPDRFAHDCAVLAAQRNLKIIGIFARLWLRDGKRGYLGLIPRVWGHLQDDLSHPTLSGLRALVSRHMPVPEGRVLARIGSAGTDA